ncbi:Ubiquinol-cytochrome-c reductase complex assembly factor 2 [Halotydeus destructor]|nr:Ubiquinol-cytochrome-c reductase complex assembly factor 2 [Halotydeus destructor]
MSKSAASLYHRYVKLCSSWSIDATKSGRDLGTFLRERLLKDFKEAEFTQLSAVDYAIKEKQIKSLENLSQDLYYKPPGAKTATATGATLDECTAAVSTAAMEELKAQGKESFVSRLKNELDQVKFLRRAKADAGGK